LAPRKVLALLIGGFFVCLVSAFSGALAALVFFGFGQPIFADAREFSALAASLAIIAAVHGMIALVIRGFVTWASEIKLKEELVRKNYETELALVKSRINPHFLFNTINNIDVLITKDPALASRYLNQLSGILRYLVYETGNERIALAAELEYLEKYLALQKIRAVNPGFVSIEINGGAGNLTIAPMIFFPFIENAFKHTENRKSSNRISIRIAAEKNRIEFECENTYQIAAETRRDFGGLGNELVVKRLQLIYPESHSLRIADEDGIYRVILTLYDN
jgi:LytS/YehU family sensor histidine kinase